MTPDQFTEMLNRLHLSQVQLARQIKATPRAVNYWAAGSRPIPGSVEAYLRVINHSPKSLRDLERDDSPSEAQRDFLPCPFCGDPMNEVTFSCIETGNGGEIDWRLNCENCYAQGPMVRWRGKGHEQAREKAEDLWNTRPQRDALQKQLDNFLSSTRIFERTVWSALGLEEQYDALDGVFPDAGEEIRKLMALQQVIDRLTSEEAVEAAIEAYKGHGGFMSMHAAITAAIRTASGNEGGEES